MERFLMPKSYHGGALAAKLLGISIDSLVGMALLNPEVAGQFPLAWFCGTIQKLP